MAQSIHGKIEITPVVGWSTRIRPDAFSTNKSSYKAGQPNLFASNITLYDGVAYAKMDNPEGKEEYGRLGEKGYIELQDEGDQVKIIVHDKDIKHYAIPRLLTNPAPALSGLYHIEYIDSATVRLTPK